MVIREYECGCKITSTKNYPGIEYCPKHKSAPKTYEWMCTVMSQGIVSPSRNKELYNEAIEIRAKAEEV